MSISNASIAALPDYTDAEILKLYRSALVNGWAGTSRTVNGKSIEFPGPDVLLSVVERLESRITATAEESGGGIAIVQYGERV